MLADLDAKRGAEIATRDNTRRKNKCTLEMRPSCYYTYYTYYAYYYYYSYSYSYYYYYYYYYYVLSTITKKK